MPRPVPRHPAALALALGALALALGALAACAPAARPPILLVVVDTLRADFLGGHGYPQDTTPALDALAADATVYRRAYSQAPWTTPSVGSLLSSQYPSVLGIQHVSSPLPGDLLLLPEFLKAQGYATAAVVSHTFVSRRWGFARGFDHFDESNVLGLDGVSSPGVSDRGLELVDALAGRPFFLLLHYFDPHFGYVEHEGFVFPGPAAPYRGPVKSAMSFERLRRLAPRLRPADADELGRLYASEVAFTDHAIGRVLDALRERGLYDDALIVVTGDHGEEFLEHAGVGHTKTLYQELVHVPLIIKYPGRPPAVVDDPVALVDVYPTIADVLGVEPAAPLTGRSLLDLRPGESHPVFMETRRGATLAGVVLGHYKLIRDTGGPPGRPPRLRLYDLAADPGERTDLSAREPRRAREMLELVARWERSNRPGRHGAPPLELDADELRHLRALGYADDAAPGAGGAP